MTTILFDANWPGSIPSSETEHSPYYGWFGTLQILGNDDNLANSVGYWSEDTCLKHIRMENVKTGILFTASGSGIGGLGDSAACTTIDDVGIALYDSSASVGIQVGDDLSSYFVKPYSSRIKANVWLGSSGGTGLKVTKGELRFGLLKASSFDVMFFKGLKVTKGELRFGQSHLIVTRESAGSGTGIDISSATTTSEDGCIIWRNQFSTFNGDNLLLPGFMLVTSNISTPINPSNAVLNGKADVLLKSF
jgi:hypothetical protein